MYKRHLEVKINKLKKQYRCITIVGPRQSGKTTLCRNLFPNYQYFSFESPDILDIFNSDPRGLLNGIKQNAIFDEVQKVPKLLSYLQEILDDKKDKRKFILTSSNSLKLSHTVSQTLAGRTTILQLLPLQRDEIPNRHQQKTLEASIFFGSYPRIYDEKLDPTDWLGNYFQTYVERDIRDTINIVDLNRFNQFIRLLGGRIGQLMSFSSLGNDAGVTQPTAKSWFSALETTYICFTLEPHFKNFNKRITKAPKVYFYDTGLLCYLLRITNHEQLSIHPLKGQIFENWVIAEYMKYFSNQGKEAPLYFWRDQHGHEIDLVIDQGTHLDLIEIKSGQTYQKDFVKNLEWLNKLQNRSGGKCIYGGSKKYTVQNIDIEQWNQLSFTG
jgi:predicted AAA+ superfamily ATPase